MATFSAEIWTPGLSTTHASRPQNPHRSVSTPSSGKPPIAPVGSGVAVGVGDRVLPPDHSHSHGHHGNGTLGREHGILERGGSSGGLAANSSGSNTDGNGGGVKGMVTMERRESQSSVGSSHG
ncbi:hypothetical protein HK097_002102 [Rhizophlyctis rosea]|uniref:Uncharacterized protein n=1 Tax=Rhizophlyctis rosea TaxID=64517 RepID=A0AAD5X6M8_9FUNG|nr:hypothetical protein HK097_002102 [Rhizophlyctis rosea]